jgi:protocatechuate 3,4-dioxygenase alpha subunit
MSDCTPSQTVGPFFHFAVMFEAGGTMVPADAPGRIVIEGNVVDGAGAAVADVFLELWQADAQGHYPQTRAVEGTFDGFGRVPTDASGHFTLATIKPGVVPGPDGRPQSPHIVVAIFGRGLLTQLITRIYFDDEPANAADPILDMVPANRRETLIARRTADARYQFDIVLQGTGETVFFQV